MIVSRFITAGLLLFLTGFNTAVADEDAPEGQATEGFEA